MAGRTQREIHDQDVQGLKYLRKLRPLLSRLRKVGTQRDKAGNRRLFMDQYCALILMSLFSPAIESLRDLQRACALDKVRKRLGVGRASLGSLSESVAIFDPAPLKEIAVELGHTIRSSPDRRFDAVGQRITAVDGTVIETVKRVAELSWTPKAKGKHLSAYRLHTHFEVLSGKAVRIDATSASPKGDADERAVLQRTIEADRCYILDRGYISYQLWNAINAAGSSYVCRSSDRTLATVTQVNELTASALWQAQRRGDPGLLRHDRLHADPDLHGRDTQQGDVPDGLVLPHRSCQPQGTRGLHRFTQGVRAGAAVASSARGVRCCAVDALQGVLNHEEGGEGLPMPLSRRS